jgi:formate dehydrogenase gamma subunit
MEGATQERIAETDDSAVPAGRDEDTGVARRLHAAAGGAALARSTGGPFSPPPESGRAWSEKVLRFRASERRLHWAIALPFLGCFTTALVLVFVYNPDPGRQYREALSIVHRISGTLLITLPLLAVTRSRHDFRIHFYNVRQAWIWVLSDVKWLGLFALASFNRRIPLPEQGKFNAAQKLNFMMVMSTYPFYVLTGLAMWLTGAALLSWLIHLFMALVAAPFLLGHIFMATVPRATRVALQGMFSGLVDRHWAKHHHARWYRQQFGETTREPMPERLAPDAFVPDE